ncbi:MAG TPA: cytochrome c oxidase subunit II [Thermoanaerobaculia bacterium]|nr:cytochrome c oxidase subunit II [Thermoanaerobaculia bacterium]
MSSFTLPFFPEEASSIAGEVDAMFAVWLAISLFFTALIAALILIFVVRYRRRADDEVGKSEHAGIWLEVTWSVIPLLIMLAMFAWGAKVFFVAHRAPADAVEYWAFGKQWMWKFQHPEGNREINHLHVPLGQAIKLSMTSEDVIHDFAVPAFRIKQDVNPGTYTFTWFRPTRIGTYHLFCDQYCGAEHSKMVGSVIVMDPRDYAAWLAGGAAAGQSPVAAGAQLFSSLACVTCHEMGPGRFARGPSLQGLFGRQVVLEGGRTVLADEAYIRESIVQPLAKIVKGWQPIMPTYQGQVSEEQLAQLIAFIKSLGNAPAMATGAEHPPGTLAPGDSGITGAASAPAPQK